jgi:hypothetical protein
MGATSPTGPGTLFVRGGDGDPALVPDEAGIFSSSFSF